MSDPSTQNHSQHSRNRDIGILFAILGGLLILVFRPFGYSTFLAELGQHNVFAILLLVSIIGIILLILQRLQLIFAYTKFEEN
jgi:Na+/melibiose symporter-like transporter